MQVPSSSQIREVNESSPIDATCTYWPIAMTMRQVCHELVGHWWDKYTIVLGVDTQAMAERLERCTVVNTQDVATRGTENAIGEVYEILFSKPNHLVNSWVAQWPVETH
jgi:hypothetical protein